MTQSLRIPVASSFYLHTRRELRKIAKEWDRNSRFHRIYKNYGYYIVEYRRRPQ